MWVDVRMRREMASSRAEDLARELHRTESHQDPQSSVLRCRRTLGGAKLSANSGSGGAAVYKALLHCCGNTSTKRLSRFQRST